MTKRKAIPDFPGYKIGDDGSVWTLWTGGRANKLGRIWKRMKPGKQKSGHLFVCLYRGKTPYNRRVHRLVLEAFVGPCPEGMECCHEDDNPSNNRLSNLRWDTRINNCKDRSARGRFNKISKNRRLNPEKVRRVRRLLANGHSQQVVADQVGISQTVVSSIHRRATWAWVE